MKQTMIEGTCDVIPPEVQEAANAYLKAKRSVANWREKTNNFLAELIEKMKANDVVEMLIDDGEKKLILTERNVVKITARKKQPEAEAPEDEADEADEAMEANVLRLSNNGQSQRAIAEELGVSERQVRKALGRL